MSSDVLKQLDRLTWQETFDAMSDFVAVLDREFRIVKTNRAMSGFLHRSSTELTGLHCYEVMHGRRSPWPQCPHNEMLKSGQSVTEEVADAHIGLPLLVTASPIMDRNGDLLGSIHIARDISALKRAQSDAERRNRELGILWSLGRSAQRSLSFDDVIQAALQGIRSAIEPDMVLFYLKEDDELVLRGHLPVEAANLNEKKQVGTCLCGLAAQQGQPVFSKNISEDDRCTLSECKDAGVRSFAALPLAMDDTMIGVIGIASRSERDYSGQREFLETITATVALAARNALLFERLKGHADDLETNVLERTAELEAKNTDLERSRMVLQYLLEEVNEANEHLRELDRLKSLFIASMSHELRTPLNSIIGFTGIMLQGLAGPLNEEQRKQLGMVKGSSEHLLSLITDIIDLSKIEAGKIDLYQEPFDLAVAVDATVRSFQVSAKTKGLALILDAPKSLLVTSDPKRVRQVLVNLVGNAIKFTEHGNVTVSLAEREGKAAIAVGDTGIGIRPEDMPKLFKQFSQITATDMQKREGTGLGLYLSQKLVTLLGGEIRAESEYGKGSMFTFTLPAGRKETT